MESGTTLINHIVYTASLATSETAIGPLDPLRIITARTSDINTLSDADRATLQGCATAAGKISAYPRKSTFIYA